GFTLIEVGCAPKNLPAFRRNLPISSVKRLLKILSSSGMWRAGRSCARSSGMGLLLVQWRGVWMARRSPAVVLTIRSFFGQPRQTTKSGSIRRRINNPNAVKLRLRSRYRNESGNHFFLPSQLKRETALILQRKDETLSIDPSAFINPATTLHIHQLEVDPEFKLLILSL